MFRSLLVSLSIGLGLLAGCEQSYGYDMSAPVTDYFFVSSAVQPLGTADVELFNTLLHHWVFSMTHLHGRAPSLRDGWVSSGVDRSDTLGRGLADPSHGRGIGTVGIRDGVASAEQTITQPANSKNQVFLQMEFNAAQGQALINELIPPRWTMDLTRFTESSINARISLSGQWNGVPLDGEADVVLIAGRSDYMVY